MKTIVEATLKAAGTQFVTVTFLTKTGKERTVNGLLIKPDEPSPAVDLGYTLIWSPRIGWRCFKTSSVISVKAGKAIITKGY